ncbi:hypothetical protein GCM10010345_81530 [Streptomyces canarius]|uniref:Uncharacterized protein n=1 Tax=Streptomyces canarius TaxID=285453 RepID=A0ABQ3DDT7_9ACTN|nr:hypothetical protein GCM10010345_81530 [Streptomyces canarius]
MGEQGRQVGRGCRTGPCGELPMGPGRDERRVHRVPHLLVVLVEERAHAGVAVPGAGVRVGDPTAGSPRSSRASRRNAGWDRRSTERRSAARYSSCLPPKAAYRLDRLRPVAVTTSLFQET